MTKEKIVLIGGGGHCKSVIDVIEHEGKFEIAGIVDVQEKVGQNILDYKVIATDQDLSFLAKKYKNFHISLGFIKSPALRIKIFEQVTSLGINLPVIISSSATVSRYARISSGSIIMHQAIINAGATVGNNCIINSGAIVEHDSIIEEQCHISTGAIVNADCYIGKGSFIGSRACINRGLKVGSNVIVGSGSVVTKNAGNGQMLLGIPAKER
jgi:sugar O-acyltransferase (sialic acid O-acetyltransferase NeuD family)